MTLQLTGDLELGDIYHWDVLQVQALEITQWKMHINNSREVSVKGKSAENVTADLLVPDTGRQPGVVIKMTVKCCWAWEWGS